VISSQIWNRRKKREEGHRKEKGEERRRERYSGSIFDLREKKVEIIYN